jgi:5-methyltetrahydrofolate--homocysteine methyltransferase
MDILMQLGTEVINGHEAEVKKLVNEAIKKGIEGKEIINNGLIKGMDVVGQKFKVGDMYVAEVLVSANSMKAGMEIIKPLLIEGDVKSAGKVIIGTVTGDLHDIGKKLVGMLMESSGLEVIDIGVDVSEEKYVEAIKKYNPDILGMSALLTTTMIKMKDIIELLQEEGIRNDIKIIVGGAPVTQDFANKIGADGWAPDAASAKDLALELIRQAN